MWVKIRSDREPLQFIQLTDMGRIRAATLPLPYMARDSAWKGINEDGTVRLESQEWYEDEVDTTGIFFNAEDGTPILLLEFPSVREAEESLENLFLAWTRCRYEGIDAQLYLVPLGPNWITDPLLNMRGGK